MHVLSFVGGANLLRHAEGATWLAIVTVSERFDTHTLGIFFFQLDTQIKFNSPRLWNSCIRIRVYFDCVPLDKKN